MFIFVCTNIFGKLTFFFYFHMIYLYSLSYGLFVFRLCAYRFSCIPILVNWHLDEKITSIQCGPDCTAIITDCENVYACGLNKCNKLGLNRPSLFKLKVNCVSICHRQICYVMIIITGVYYLTIRQYLLLGQWENNKQRLIFVFFFFVVNKT